MFILKKTVILIFLLSFSSNNAVFKYYEFGDTSYYADRHPVVYHGKVRPDGSSTPIEKFKVCMYVMRKDYKSDLFYVTTMDEVDQVFLGMNNDYIFMWVDSQEVRLYIVPPLLKYISLCFYWRSSDGKAGIYSLNNEGRDQEISTYGLKKGYKIFGDNKIYFGYRYFGTIGNFQMWDNNNPCDKDWMNCESEGNLVSLNKGNWTSTSCQNTPCEHWRCPIKDKENAYSLGYNNCYMTT